MSKSLFRLCKIKYKKNFRDLYFESIILDFILNLNSVNQLIFVMVKCGVLFEVRTEFLNNI
jgi:hypothetical protein